MPIIRHRKIEPDDWQQLPDTGDDGTDLPEAGAVVLPLPALLKNADAVLRRTAPTGVLLQPADDIRQLEPFLASLSLVAIEFPAFTEGRGYSQARLLRERYGFSGEIRAVGEVTRDRLGFMERCGFDAFVLRSGESSDDAPAAFSEISLRYQPAADSNPVVRQTRLARGA